MMNSLSLIFLVSYYFTSVYSSTQSAGARGRLLCYGKPISGVRVELYDVDRFPGDSDEFLGQNTTSINGTFIVSGYTSEFTSIEPTLYIYPNCVGSTNDKMTFEIPKDFITKGYDAEKFYDIGTIELGTGTAPNSPQSMPMSQNRTHDSSSSSKKESGMMPSSGVGLIAAGHQGQQKTNHGMGSMIINAGKKLAQNEQVKTAVKSAAKKVVAEVKKKIEERRNRKKDENQTHQPGRIRTAVKEATNRVKTAARKAVSAVRRKIDEHRHRSHKK